MTAGGFSGVGPEVINAVGRVLEASDRSVTLGLPNTVVAVADLITLVRAVRSSGPSATEAEVRIVNGWIDGQLSDADSEFGGAGVKAQAAWSTFEANGGATPALLSSEALTLIRLGFLCGHLVGQAQGDRS